MNIWIARNQKLYGPYPVELAHRYLQAGNLLVRDHAWIKGMGKWDTLEQVLPRAEQLALLSNEKVLTGDLTRPYVGGAEALRLGGYSRITKVAAEELSKHAGDIVLDDLSCLSPDEARLITSRSSGVSLEGIAELTPEVADALSSERCSLACRFNPIG